MPQGSGPLFPTTNSGTSKTVTDLALGSYPYYCDFHGPSGMTGAIFVRP
jgi:plastocyanin